MSAAPLSGPTGSRRLRRHRISVPNQVYHVTTVTHGRNPVFADFNRGRIVVDSIRRESASGRCETLCFVVMPDHLHWLVQVSPSSLLSSIVRNVKSYSGQRIRRSFSSADAIWQSGFHDHAMRRDEDLVATARYIIANPVRAGLVKRVGDYPLWDAVWI
jgi:REP element-mobilizing transposase RayT